MTALSVPPAVHQGPTTLAIVVPCYNEEEVLPETARRLSGVLDAMAEAGLVSPRSAIHFVDDGSRDGTWGLITGLARANPQRFRGIKLSRNVGHQAALLAGLRVVPGDAVISIDADLQDDPAAMAEMVSAFRTGCDVVFGVRRNRSTDTAFKRRTARAFYALQRGLGVEAIADHADYRLLSRRALDALGKYGEVNIFLRALVPLLGFRTAQVLYDRAPRFAGVSKYPLRRMVRLALDGITSFSMRPLRLITLAGLTVSLLSFLAGIGALLVGFLSNRAVPGWTSTVVPSLFIGGLQLLALGVIGEYVGNIYLEVKRRPLFEVEEMI